MIVRNDLKTKEQITYEKLKDLIIRGSLPHGEFLSQRMLSAKADTTLVNIRTALRKLENDGLIENIPHWGVRIPVEDEEAIRDRYYVREVLEIAAVKRIVKKRPITNGPEMIRLAVACDAPSSGPDDNVQEYAAIHFEFHCAVVEASGSPILLEAYRKIQLASMMLWNAKRGWLLGKEPGPNHHEHLIKAILNASEHDAVAAAKAHILSGLKNELEEFAVEQSKRE